MDKIEDLELYPLAENEPLILRKLVHDRMQPQHKVVGLLVDSKIVQHGGFLIPAHAGSFRKKCEDR